MRFALPWLPTDNQVRSTESRSPRVRMPQSGSGNGLSAARPKEHLLRILGVGFGIAVIIGGVIGYA